MDRRFLFKLAAHLGKTVGELAHSMSFSEFMEWQAFDIIDPIGGFRQDIQTAYWMSRLYGDKNHSMVDYMPINPNPMTEEQLAELKNAQTIAEARAEVMELIAMLNNRA